MKKAGFLFILSLTITIHMFTQENNYLINDIANLIGLDCNEAIVRMEEIYKEAYKMEYEIVIDDNLIIFKPILDVTAFSGMGIAMYILMPDIMLIKNDEEIIISVSSENIIMHDITRLDVINELDEKTRTLAEMQIISVQIYSMTMIENDEIFNIF